MEVEVYDPQRPYDSTWDMYYDEFEDLDDEGNEIVVS